MSRFKFLLSVLVVMFVLHTSRVTTRFQRLDDDAFLELVSRKAFQYFWDQQNPKTGLVQDATGSKHASITATGFGLTALVIGAERGWVQYELAYKRALKILDTFLDDPYDPTDLVAEGKDGFFYHFLEPNTAKRAGRSEVSVIDTAILLCGALTAGEYFGKEVKDKAQKLYENVQWNKFLDKQEGPHYNQFYGEWTPERGFSDWHWDYYSDEAIIISLLAIGSPTHAVDPEVFYRWERVWGSYKGIAFIQSWHGALYTYQYAHAWFDLRGQVDREGVDWWQNSINATLANREFCIDNASIYRTYGPNSWGITACWHPRGYMVEFGSPPRGDARLLHDGTISPAGPAGSIVFSPSQSLAALRHLYKFRRLWGPYGFRSSFNLDQGWYAPAYYGIEVGITLLMIENQRSGLIWKTFMRNPRVQHALRTTGFKPKPGVMGQEIVTTPEGPVSTDPVQHQRRKQSKLLK